VTTRDEFLSVIRERLRRPIPENPLRPLIAPGPDEPVRYAVDLSNPERRLVQAATGAGAEIVGTPADELAAVLQGVQEDVRATTAVISDDPECEGVAQILASLGVEVLPVGDPAVVATADLGVTGALCGVALTGSVLMDSRRARTRLASLLPEVHLVLLARERIAPTPGDVFRQLTRWLPEGLPSNLVFITGPSRSADIELEITVGVHGPRRVLIALR
jgi:L-lactate utilization protein LutC